MMNRRLAFATLFTLTACGGTEHPDLLDVTADAVEESDDVELARFPAADESERRFDATLTSHPSLKPFLSRVELAPGDDCPTRLSDGLSLPFRCINSRTGRHTAISDVDVIDPETPIRFHALGAALDNETREASLGECPLHKQPNGFADLHVQGVKKFVAAGWHRREGTRRYNVLYRRVGDTYKLLPGRPRLDRVEWDVIKPAGGICVRLDD